MDLNKLWISGESLYLDDMEIKGVTGYAVNKKAQEPTKLILEMYVTLCERKEESAPSIDVGYLSLQLRESLIKETKKTFDRTYLKKYLQ